MDKKLILVSPGKIMSDFEYIFSDIYVIKKICNAEEIKTCVSSQNNSLFVLCQKKGEALDSWQRILIEKFGSDSGGVWCYAEDLFETLDYDIKKQLRNRRLIYCHEDKSVDVLDIDGEILKPDKIVCAKELSEYSPDESFVIYDGYSFDKVPLLRKQGYKSLNDFISVAEYRRRKLYRPSELLKKTVYADPQEQNDCNYPFEFAKINSVGDVYNCSCEAFMDINIGNVNTETLDEIWNGIYAKIIRLSIINRTFCFCRDSCKLIDPQHIKSKDNYKRLFHREISAPNRVCPCIDGSCNLYCESCRDEIRCAKGNQLKEIEFYAEALSESSWLKKKGVLQLSGWGEVFFSPTYRKLLFDKKNGKIDIQILSNGTLFTPEQLDRLIDQYGQVKEISLSVDASTRETYEHLRRGGRWDKLYKNLCYIGKKRGEGKVRKLILSFVVQRENYIEIPDFIRMAIDLNADIIDLINMRHFNSGLTEEEYKKKSMLTDNGEALTEELKQVLQDPILSDPRVSWEWFRHRMDV